MPSLLSLLCVSIFVFFIFPSVTVSCGRRFNQSVLDNEILSDDDDSVEDMIAESRQKSSLEYQKWGFILYAESDEFAESEWRRLLMKRWEKVKGKHQKSLDERSGEPNATTLKAKSPLSEYLSLKSSLLNPIIPSIDLTEIIRSDPLWGRELKKLKGRPNGKFNPKRLVVDDETNPKTLIDSTDLHRLYRCDIIQLAASKGFHGTVAAIFNSMDSEDPADGIAQKGIWPQREIRWPYSGSENCKLHSVIQMSPLSPLHLATLFAPTKDDAEKSLRFVDFLINRINGKIDEIKGEIIRRWEGGQGIPSNPSFSSMSTRDLYSSFYRHHVLYLKVDPQDENVITMSADRGNAPLFFKFIERAMPPLYQNEGKWKEYKEGEKEGEGDAPMDDGEEEGISDDDIIDGEDTDEDTEDGEMPVPSAGVLSGDPRSLAARRRAQMRAARKARLSDPLLSAQNDTADGAFEILPDGSKIKIPFESDEIPRDHKAFEDDKTQKTLRVPPEFRIFRRILHAAFHYAVMNGSIPIVNYFIENRHSLKLNLNWRSHDGKGDTALHGCCMSNNPLFLRMLLDNGADWTLRTNNEKWPLEQVCQAYRAEDAYRELIKWKKQKKEKEKDTQKTERSTEGGKEKIHEDL